MAKAPYRKTCAICGKVIREGTGTYYHGRLIHRTCLGLAKIFWYGIRK
jgi:hypothetical protein